MRLDDYRTLFATVGFILVLVFSSPIVITFLPRNEESFLTIAILGENGAADQYYPDGNSNIGLGVPVRWYIQLYNHVGHSQYVVVRAKLLNLTLLGPDSSLGLPSPETFFFEFSRFLAMNETLTHPFFWHVSNVTYDEDTVAINELTVNNVALCSNSRALEGYNFRLVFELWFYNESSREFEFARNCMGKPLCVWNQIWFNVTLAY